MIELKNIWFKIWFRNEIDENDSDKERETDTEGTRDTETKAQR